MTKFYVSFVAGAAAMQTLNAIALGRTWWPWLIATAALLAIFGWLMIAVPRAQRVINDAADEAADRRSIYDHEQQAMALANGRTSERAVYATGIAPLKHLGEK